MKLLSDAPMHTDTKCYQREVPGAMLQLEIIVVPIQQLVIFKCEYYEELTE